MFTPAMAGLDDPQNIISATVFESNSQVSAKINVVGDIIIAPNTLDRGTGILLEDGSLAVTASHPRFFDSELQTTKDDPIPHNHYVDLEEGTGLCANAFQVKRISHQSPGIAEWQGKMYKMWEVPKVSPSGTTDFFTGNPGDLHTFTLGSVPENPEVVTFRLSPTDVDANTGIPTQVCVSIQDSEFADLEDLFKVGGHTMVIDSNALLLAGIQSTAIWMLPVLAVAAGAGFTAFKLRRK